MTISRYSSSEVGEMCLTEHAFLLAVGGPRFLGEHDGPEADGVVAAQEAPVVGVGEGAAVEGGLAVALDLTVVRRGRELQRVHRDDREAGPDVVAARGGGCNKIFYRD